MALQLPLLPQSNHLLVADKSMPFELRRAIWLLGASQCVLWGVLYYSFSVFLVPMAHDLGLSRTTVAGAFSLGLFVMASSAPSVGRLLDRGYAAQLVRGGIALAVAGLIVLSLVPNAKQLHTKRQAGCTAAPPGLRSGTKTNAHQRQLAHQRQRVREFAA